MLDEGNNSVPFGGVRVLFAVGSITPFFEVFRSDASVAWATVGLEFANSTPNLAVGWDVIIDIVGVNVDWDVVARGMGVLLSVECGVGGGDGLEVFSGWFGGASTGVFVPAFEDIEGLLEVSRLEVGVDGRASNVGAVLAVFLESFVNGTGELSCPCSAVTGVLA